MTALPVPILSPRLAAHRGVRHGFFTREGGVSAGLYEGLNVGLGSGDDQAMVAENRRRAAAALGVGASDLLTCRQVHSARVRDADAEGLWERPEGDGLVTERSAILLGVLSADCAPVLFFAPKAGAVGAVHAGWRGALGGVIEAAVAALGAKGAAPAEIVAAVGPCIGPASYEVGLEFEARFLAEDQEAAAFFAKASDPSKRLFDLPAFILSRLARAGVADAHWVGRDTYAEPSIFYSHRRSVRAGEPDYGRLLSAIRLA